MGPSPAIWEHLGGASWAILGNLEQCWAILGRFRLSFTPSWDVLGCLVPVWDSLGAILGCLESVLGPSWACLRVSWPLERWPPGPSLGDSCDFLGALLGLRPIWPSLGALEASWGSLGAFLGFLGAFLGLS